jgi:hypothetical protein
MTDKQINEIMELVEKYGVNCWSDSQLGYEFGSDERTQESVAAIESAIRAVPAIPEGWKLVPSVPTNEWIGNLAKQQSGSLEEVPFLEIHQCIAELLEASPQAPDHPEDVLGMAQAPQAACWCETCDLAQGNPMGRTRMSVCPQCGDKRCPRAKHHDNACSAQPAPPRKPLFEDLIARHQGLREELSAMDAQPADWTEQTR